MTYIHHLGRIWIAVIVCGLSSCRKSDDRYNLRCSNDIRNISSIVEGDIELNRGGVMAYLSSERTAEDYLMKFDHEISLEVKDLYGNPYWIGLIDGDLVCWSQGVNRRNEHSDGDDLAWLISEKKK